MLLLSGCGREQPRAQPAPPKVTVQRPFEREITDYREFTGRIDAVETAEIRVRVKGYLSKIEFKEGAEVKKGDLLYQIDPSTFEADLAKAEAAAKQQEANLQLAITDVQRVEALRGTVGALPEETYSQKIAAREVARAALQQAQAGVVSSKLELSFTKIYAPIDGQISRTLVTEGNLVGYNEPTLLTTIVRLDPVYVFFDAPEREFLDYQRLIREEGAASAVDDKVPVFVELANETDFPHKGMLNFRDNRIDQGTGTVLLRGEVPNSDRLLIPGLFARVRVPVGKPKPRLLVPDMALSSDQRGEFLLIVKSDNTVESRVVKTGSTEKGLTIIEQGLNRDDLVVVNGLQRARPGAKVEPMRKESKDSNAPPADFDRPQSPAAPKQPPSGSRS